MDSGRGVGPLKNGVYLDFADAIGRVGQHVIEERYGNLFEMYERITDEDPYHVPMRIYPAPHYTMGGLWVDYELMTTIPGLYAAGEANFSDHGANRLGASALMQGLADGYFVLPATMGNYLAPRLGTKPVPTDHPAFQAVEQEARARYDGYLADRAAPARSTGSTASWAGSCGTTAAWSAPRRASRRRWRRSRRCTRSSARTCGCRVVPVSTSRSRRPAGWTTSSSWRRSCAGTPSTATRAAAATSGPSTRPRTARRGATTSTTPTWRRGSGRASPTQPSLHKEPLVFDDVHLAVRSYK